MNTLQLEYERLLEVKERLQREIDTINEKEALAVAKSDNYIQQKFLFRKLPIDWIDTTFSTARNNLVPHISSTFSALDLKQIIDILSLSKEAYKVAYCVMLCNDVIDSGYGIVLKLQDPYRSIVSYPLKNIPYEKAKYWESRMLVVKIRITRDAFINNEYYIERVKVLKYTKYGIIENGNERLINSYDKKMYKNIIGGNKDLDELEKYFRENEYCVYREEKGILNICNRNNKCTFVVLNNQIYHILDDANNITDMDINLLKYNEELLVIKSDYAELVYNQFA